MADTDQAAVTVEVELANSSLGPDGSYQSANSGQDQLAGQAGVRDGEGSNPARNSGSAGR